ncbi:hypothetical protein SFC07_04720 [Corynebacterium callunae]|uniref:Rv3654c family TadE-like protein n=1 Tax=Corynebacterium callunae TaxID=1721 RepID=UPI00398216F8
MLSTLWRTNDAGYATVAGAGFAAALGGLLILVAGQAGGLLAREQAQVAADLAAVAGAYAYARGEPAATACSRAQEIAELNKAHLKRCSVEGVDLIVATTIKDKEAWAKAGPL